MLTARIYSVQSTSFLKVTFETIQDAAINQHLRTPLWRLSSSLIAGCTPSPCHDRHFLASDVFVPPIYRAFYTDSITFSN